MICFLAQSFSIASEIVSIFFVHPLLHCSLLADSWLDLFLLLQDQSLSAAPQLNLAISSSTISFWILIVVAASEVVLADFLSTSWPVSCCCCLLCF